MASQETSWEQYWEKTDIFTRLDGAEKMLLQLSETFQMMARSIRELKGIIKRTEASGPT